MARRPKTTAELIADTENAPLLPASMRDRSPRTSGSSAKAKRRGPNDGVRRPNVAQADATSKHVHTFEPKANKPWLCRFCDLANDSPVHTLAEPTRKPKAKVTVTPAQRTANDTAFRELAAEGSRIIGAGIKKRLDQATRRETALTGEHDPVAKELLKKPRQTGDFKKGFKDATQPKTKPEGRSAFQQLFDRWVKGEQLAALATESGTRRSKFRRMIIAECGGKDAFKSYRNEGAGRTADGAGRPGRTKEVVTGDDSHLPMLTSTKTTDGWTARRMHKHTDELVHRSPDGIDYVLAEPMQKADIIRLSQTPGLPNVRLRQLHAMPGAVVATPDLAADDLEAIEHGLEAEAIDDAAAKRKARAKARKARQTTQGDIPEVDPPARPRTRLNRDTATTQRKRKAIVENARGWDEPSPNVTAKVKARKEDR